MAILEPTALALTVPTALGHRPAQIPQVSVQQLLPKHGDECGER